MCQLQDELAKAQTFSQRLSSELRESETQLSDIDIQSELDAQRRELEVDQHRKLVAMKEALQAKAKAAEEEKRKIEAEQKQRILELEKQHEEVKKQI